MAMVVLQPADAVDECQSRIVPTQVTTHAEGVQTQLDGSFSIQHVSPGTYYVMARAPQAILSALASFSAHLGDDSKSQEALKEPVCQFSTARHGEAEFLWIGERDARTRRSG